VAVVIKLLVTYLGLPSGTVQQIAAQLSWHRLG
jgi:hypothetical protein